MYNTCSFKYLLHSCSEQKLLEGNFPDWKEGELGFSSQELAFILISVTDSCRTTSQSIPTAQKAVIILFTVFV